MTRNQETFIEGIANEAGASQEFVDELKREAAERILVNHLLALRGAKGISQEEIAKHFGCSQSKISKLENGKDSDLRIGDLLEYCDAIGLELSVGMFPKGATLIDRIKQHAFCIQDELNRLVAISQCDEMIADGVAKAHTEILLNLVKLVSDSAGNLPNHPASNTPRIQIETLCKVTTGVDSPENSSDASTDRSPTAVA